jgi:hypothetical protein
MDNTKRIATLTKQLDVLRRRHADHERSLAELERLGSKQAPLIKTSRDKVATRIASVERRLAALQDEPELAPTSVVPLYEEPLDEDVLAECNVTDPDVLTVREIKEHARLCDEHAAALAVNIKALHQKITALRMKRGGRGPSSIVVPSALERAAAKHFTGTVLRSIRGPVPRPNMGGFKEQVELWLPSLMPPKKVAA